MDPARTARALVTRGRLARDEGCHLETIRYYEQIGLLTPAKRSPAGYRLYGERERLRLRFILRGRGLGLGVGDLRSLLGLVDGGAYGCGEVHAIAVRHLAHIRARIARLQHLERKLAEVSGRCAAWQDPGCPIVETLFDEPGRREPLIAGPTRRRSRPPRRGKDAGRPSPPPREGGR